jgi:hypothetical protein
MEAEAGVLTVALNTCGVIESVNAWASAQAYASM